EAVYGSRAVFVITGDLSRVVDAGPDRTTGCRNTGRAHGTPLAQRIIELDVVIIWHTGGFFFYHPHQGRAPARAMLVIPSSSVRGNVRVLLRRALTHRRICGQFNGFFRMMIE